MGELEQLLALVKQKETEIADNDSNLKVVDNKINKVVSGFKEIHSSIQQGITSFKQRIIFTDKRVSKLEAEKKVVTEAKSLCVEKESIQIDMDTRRSVERVNLWERNLDLSTTDTRRSVERVSAIAC